METSPSAPPHLPQRAGKAVLLVAAEPFVRELMATQLRAAGCFPMAVASADEGKRLAAQMVPDLIVTLLDVEPTQGARRWWKTCRLRKAASPSTADDHRAPRSSGTGNEEAVANG